jgi:quinolinate synthase
VKAESDICCTSSNSIKVVNSLEQDEVIFVPDYNLAMYTQRFTSKKILPWNGFCPTHHQITAGDILISKMDHPGAEVVVHPGVPAGGHRPGGRRLLLTDGMPVREEDR